MCKWLTLASICPGKHPYRTECTNWAAYIGMVVSPMETPLVVVTVAVMGGLQYVMYNMD